jgi:hypothetical protein
MYPLACLEHAAALVVEETDVLLHKGDAQLLGRGKDLGVVLAAARRGNKFGSRSGDAVYVVGEGELEDNY